MGAAENWSTLTEGILPLPVTTTAAFLEGFDVAAENAYARAAQGKAAPKQVSRTTSAPSAADLLAAANAEWPSTNEV